MITATAVEIRAVRMDSLKNCNTRLFLCAPFALRSPISFALDADLAVLRFMKLMQAMISTSNAIEEKIQIFRMAPGLWP
jgi:hypothetical protein